MKKDIEVGSDCDLEDDLAGCDDLLRRITAKN